MNLSQVLWEPARWLLERRYAEHYGWNLDLMRGKAEVEPGWKDKYRVEGSVDRMMSSDLPIDRISMAEAGRFGNRVIQIKNAMHVAERVGANDVRVKSLHELFRPNEHNRIYPHSGAATSGMPSSEVVLRGSFYCHAPLNIALTAADHASLTERYVRPLMKETVMAPDPRVGSNDMALHFRAGDIMSGPTIHSHYGQPPVCFYLKAVELAGPDRVWLVCEDFSNPAIALVEQRLKDKGVEVLRQSASLEEDCRVILSVPHFATSTGTFGYALAEISTRMRSLYSFYEFEYCPLIAFEKTPVEVTRIIDEPGDYKAAILSQNWSASERQIEMMLDYPGEQLSITPR